MAGQLWSVDAVGGYMHSLNLSDKLRMEVLPVVKFRQFCDAKDATEMGLHKGQAFNWNVYSRLAVGGGSLDETEEMPVSNFTITQKALTVTEYGNAVPYSGKLDDLSLHDVTEIVHRVLKIDCVETLDGAAHAQFNNTFLEVQPASGTSTTAITVTTGGTVGSATTIAINKTHIKLIVDQLKERNIPPYMGDDYFAIARPSTWRTFKDDLEGISQYVETGFAKIRNGEIGRYEGMRFTEQTSVATGGAEDSTTWTFRVADAWNNAPADWAFFFGEDTVAEAIVIPEEVRGKIPTDYGRSRGVAWYYLGGFGLVHGSDAATVLNARIMKWESTV